MVGLQDKASYNGRPIEVVHDLSIGAILMTLNNF